MVNHRYRFTSTSATATVVTNSDVVGIIGAMVTVVNTSARLLAGTCKLRSVEVWTPPASQGAAATCSLEWASTTFSPNTEVSDTTVSVSEPAHIRAIPPRGSPQSFWMTADGTAMFTLTAPVGSIIDVSCVHVLNDTGAAGNSYSVGAAATLGVLFYPPLDGVTDVYLPVSLNTIT